MEVLRTKISRRKGYTLIELIVVLVLFSLLLTIIIPNVSILKTYSQNMQLRILEKDLKQARNTAIIENRIIFVDFHIATNSYIIKYNEKEKIVERKLINGVELINKNFTTLKLNPNGVIGNAGTLTIKKGFENYKLSIAAVTSNISVKKDE